MKDILKKQQPRLLRILSNIKSNNRISHAYLLVGEENIEFEKISKFIVKSFLCDNDIEGLACENCSICNRVENNNYADFILYDATKEKIGKQEILSIKEQFGKTSQEGSKKIYVIENIEDVTTSALNSLLLFLENPTDDVIAIFTTSKLNKVLNTIKSRCQIINLEKRNREEIKKQLLKDNNQITANYLSYFEEENSELIIELLPKFIKFLNLYSLNNLKYINYILNEIFNDKDRIKIQIFAKLLKIFVNDYYQNNDCDDEEYIKLINNFKDEEILKLLIISNEIENNNFKGSNINLLIDKLIYLLEAKNG